jgi:hypothetical protein
MRSGGLFWLLAAAATAGCTGTISAAGTPDDAQTAMATSAVIIVERTVDATQGTRAEASARFVRVAAPSSVVEGLRAIGASGELPARGTCASVVSVAGGVATDEPAPYVELLDVGSVSLVSGANETHLLPRQVPDVTDVVTGVVYARATDPTGLPAGETYSVHVAGRPDLAAFDASAVAPPDPGDIHVAGENLDAGTLVLLRGAAVELTWTPDATGDVVYADAQPAAVRCVLAESEKDSDNRVHATLPASLFDDRGSLVVHRLHREPLRAPGLESGEIRFDFARSMAYVRAAASGDSAP